MTKEEVIAEIEEYIQDSDRCISEDDDYIRGWKAGLMTALEILEELE